jgi:hypothetical protein
MPTIYELKEQAVTDTPLLLFDCALPDGTTERWSTHSVSVGGNEYAARVLGHNVFELQASSDQGVDGVPKITLVLANADSRFSEIERQLGWKGAKMSAGLIFYDLRSGEALTEPATIFQGICNPPDEIQESTFRITATNRMNLQRILLPQVRIQRRCPWEFPGTTGQRTEALAGGASGKYSRYYRCGYSPDVTGGSGTLNAGSPFTGCGFTRSDCQARGMFPNFGGIEFVPPAISVRTYGDKNWHTSAVSVNGARYNDFVPVVYGTAWYNPPVVFARNDGNLTRMEVLLGIGEIQSVIKVLVNDVDIPPGVAGTNMTGTGWYNVPTLGTRSGAFDNNFLDGSGQPTGDPYGSMAYASVVVPNQVNNGTTLPKVAVLLQGLKLPVYASDGTYVSEQFSANPAWILLDVLRRAGWGLGELNLASFAAAAARCDEPIDALDLYGNAIQLPRFQCNLVLQNRKSAGDLIRGVRNSARLMLSYGTNGLLELRMENSLALELPAKPAWSNAPEPLDGGWPSYEFGDGSNGISGIARKSTGEPAFRVLTRSMADTPNRFAVEFQDSLNDYQQDSFSIVDADDVARTGQEVSQTLAALGLPNFDQAGRILKLNLDKSVRGNTYVEFQTSVKGFGIRPGDLITITYQKEGFERQLFRVQKISPGANHRLTTITAQLHDDAWYADSNGQATSGTGGRRQDGAGIGLARPLMGTLVDANGDIQFGVAETDTIGNDGASSANLTVSFTEPPIATPAGPGIPLVSLAATVGSTGTLHGGQILYYGVSAVDTTGNESRLSFLVRAVITADNSSVTIGGLSFSPATVSFNVYRGATPAQLYRIASGQDLAAQYTDTGFDKQIIAAPDPNFDHANFYWRTELQPETSATTYNSTSVGNDGLTMVANRYRGAIVRITRGTGGGEERTISSNTATTLTIAPPWTVTPDATSHFSVAEAGWQFGAQGRSSPVQFGLPNRGGETVQICGRAANVNDLENTPELSIVTRWQLGGTAGGDSDVPPEPFFGLGFGAHGGAVELSGVSFSGLTNTTTVTSGTLTLRYWNELSGTPTLKLALAASATDTSLSLSATGTAAPGSFIQIDGEVIRVDSISNGGTQYQVTRAMNSSTAAAHPAQAAVYPLLTHTAIAVFPPGFFGSPYSGSWSQTVELADARVASAEFFVTNRRGNSPTHSICLTGTVDLGLRTLSGGQYTIQVDGYLAVENSVAPPLVMEAAHSVRDVFAVLGSVADAPVNVRVDVDGQAYCTLSVPAGWTVSPSVDGRSAGPLAGGAKITVAVTQVGQTLPGADLTVLIRL